MKNTRSMLTALVSTLLLLSVGCSASVDVARKDVRSGTLLLQGPLMPASRLARAAMVEHCQGRYVVKAEGKVVDGDQGATNRFVAYQCARPLELATR